MSDLFDFTPEQRAIFQYHDGEKAMFGDPLEIRRRIRFTIPNYLALIQQNQAGEDVLNRKATAQGAEQDLTDEEMVTVRMAQVAHEKLVNGVRAVFGLAEFDQTTGRGCTTDMAIAVWNSFQNFGEKKDGNTPTTQTSSAPSEAAA